jgi:hypothetical protein
MRGVNDAFKYNRVRKNMIIGGAAILIFITALSCVSSFLIYRAGFGDRPSSSNRLRRLRISRRRKSGC